MPMTDEELKLALGNEETRYPAIVARLDESDIPRVRALAESSDVGLASKAVYLAGLLESEGAHDIVARAARSDREDLRVASAVTLANLPLAARERVAEVLIEDPNPAVSKMVLRAIDRPSPALAQKLRELEQRSTIPEIRQFVRQKLDINK